MVRGSIARMGGVFALGVSQEMHKGDGGLTSGAFLPEMHGLL